MSDESVNLRVGKYMKPSDYNHLDNILKSERTAGDGTVWKMNGEGQYYKAKAASEEDKAKYNRNRDKLIKQCCDMKGESGDNYKSYLSKMSDEKLRSYHGQLVEGGTTEVKKSVVQMGHHTDGGDIETSNVAVDRVHANAEWLERLHVGMDGFEYGDVPREFSLDKGMLYLSKVDDGLYSGFFKYMKPTENEATGEMEVMQDTAKIRIEKQTLPTLTQLLMAKEWINALDERIDQREVEKMNPAIPMQMSEEDEKYQALEAKLAEIEDGVESAIEATLAPTDNMDKKIKVLELVNKLLS